MFRKIWLTLFLLILGFFSTFTNVRAARDCTVLWPSDYNTFKEYCYKITDSFLSLRNRHQVDAQIDTYIAGRILNYAKQWLNYLPEDLVNKNYYTHLQTAIERGLKDPKNVANFDAISKAINDFLNETKIQEVNWEIEVYPESWNAPLTVTLRWNVIDPTWSQLYPYNYTWWILDKWGKRKNIWSNNYLNYTFREEGNYSIFLDVTSNHRNANRNIDVIPFSKKVDISVKEKVASLILKVNSKSLDSSDELKFTPEEAVYGLMFDATSSIPNSGTKFIATEWEFWNWVIKKYSTPPKMERVVYATEWDFPVTLRLKTNTWKTIERKFTVIVRNPIATINASSLEWFLWDKFTFTANSFSKNENLTYFWEIVDLKNDKVVFSKNLSTLTYTFNEKWRYNVKLAVTSPSWEKDYDTKIIHINSRPPVAMFTFTIPNSNKPNTVFLDASGSYDLDFSDDWKLEYNWIIDGERVELENPNFNGSNGYYTFTNIWEHSVVLEVIDPDDLSSQKNAKVNILSNLSVDFFAFPRVSQVWWNMKFVADSSKAKFFEWDFWDWTVVWGKEDTINHKYEKAWIYTVKLSVRDDGDGKNSFEKVIYVWDSDQPYANISVKWNTVEGNYWYEEWVCNWKGAYIINKVDNVNLSWADSIDVTWESNGLDYSWKIGDKFYTSQELSRKFDDIWCIPIKLTVKSQKTWKEASAETYLKVQNLKPELTWLDVQAKDLETDPVVVDVRALWATDRDWVVQSYLWYYYTDVSSEPQDFRATKTPSTTFVLPKITWTYYFVVVLKDNNEERTSSEELTSSKYYVTLTWDNINTPIVGISANNTSVKAWDEVIFTTTVTNILWQNLNDEVKYSWDFDWDGFYDLETTKNVVNHTFVKSWEHRVKVKVKNKWFSNTKSITINVSNILKPEFDYVSIWNDFVFFDKSSWSTDRRVWDMWDGQILEKKDSFTYTYTDGKAIHLVKLKLVEWTNVKEISKKVVRDFWKMISTRKTPLTIFSNQTITDDKIILKEEPTSLELFLKTSLPTVKAYGVDYNIENDSDLNWWKDDDEDNKKDPSYTTWWPVRIELNNQKIQKIRIFLKDWDNKVIETKDLTIEKQYVKDEQISTDEIKLEWVSESLKATFDKIKDEILKLDAENRLKWLTYLQRLKEEWNDDREKTNVIMEFTKFIEELNIKNWSEITNLLSSLLVESQENKTDNARIFNALKNLIPKDIACSEELSKEAETKKQTCRDILVSKLQLISDNTNLDENKALWKEILEAISNDGSMTVEQKKDFKALLSKLVNKDKAPEPGEVPPTDDNRINTWDWFFWKIWVYFLWTIWGVFVLFILWFIIYGLRYKLSWSRGEQSFTDYVSEKVNDSSNDVLSDIDEEKKEENSFDPLSDDMNNIKKISEEPAQTAPDWLKSSFDEADLEKTEEVKPKEDEPEEIKQDNQIVDSWDVPDWLKWNMTEEPNNLQENVDLAPVDEFAEEPEEQKVDDSVPDWLKTSTQQEETQQPVVDEFAENEQNLAENQSTENTPDVPEWLLWANTEQKQNDFKDEFTQEPEVPKVEAEPEIIQPNEPVVDDSIPDWLKPTVEENPDSTENQVSEQLENSQEAQISENIEPVENIEKTKNTGKKSAKSDKSKEKLEKTDSEDILENIQLEEEPKLETKEELDEFTKIDFDEEENKKEDNIPDWLKWTFSDEVQKAKDKKEETKSETATEPTEIKTDDFASFESLWTTEEVPEKKKTTSRKKKTTTKKTEKKQTKKSWTKEENTENNSSEEKSSDDELWDDWMKIPDWLKSDSDK